MKFVLLFTMLLGILFTSTSVYCGQQVFAEYDGVVATQQVQQYPVPLKEDKTLHITLESKDRSAYFLIKEEKGQSLIQLETTDWTGRVPKGNYTVDVFVTGKATRQVEFHLKVEEIMSPVGLNQKPDSDLVNTRWKLVQLDGNEITTPEDGSDIYLTLQLDSDKVNGYAGCNNFFGNYEVNDNTLRFSRLAATKRACPQLDLESAFLSMLESIEEYRIEGEQLTLYAEGEPVAVFEALYLQ